jgi:hypothetical protein
VGAEQEVDGVAVFVDGPVEIFPLALDADVRLVHSPALSNWPLAMAKRFLQYRQKFERPAMDGRMIDRSPTFGHHFFKITQTQRIRDVPAHARQNHLQRIVQAFQYLGKRRVQRLHRFSHQRLCIAGILPSISYCDIALCLRLAEEYRNVHRA